MIGFIGRRRWNRDRAFSLIEMMFVMLFTAIVMSLAIDFYLQISEQSAAAVRLTETDRRAALVLDRIARELQETVLVEKPEEVDPLTHPWFFIAEASRGGDGADRLKFQTRAHRPRSEAAHESDLATVAFFTAPDDTGEALELLRWSRPRLPENLDTSFPRRDDSGVQVLAADVASFGVRLQDENGEWSDRWDSAIGLERAGQLPIQVELLLVFAAPDAEPQDLLAEPEPFLRRVVLPIRPLDLVPEEGDNDPEEPCVTVAECEERNPEVFESAEAANPTEFPSLFESVGGQCFGEVASALGIDQALVVGCQ
ncbi:MAG: hypothetical protein GY723_16285 [bacterium]|nr:hypothetical protein [bacterium]MCP5067909.1 hypothetical protein [bacterium]